MTIDIERLAARAEQASRLLGAMATPKRLMILCELTSGECSVSELTERLDARQSTISQHLALLRKDGFVASRREGQTQYYSLVGDEVRSVLCALHSLYCAPPERRRIRHDVG